MPHTYKHSHNAHKRTHPHYTYPLSDDGADGAADEALDETGSKSQHFPSGAATHAKTLTHTTYTYPLTDDGADGAADEALDELDDTGDGSVEETLPPPML